MTIEIKFTFVVQPDYQPQLKPMPGVLQPYIGIVCGLIWILLFYLFWNNFWRKELKEPAKGLSMEFEPGSFGNSSSGANEPLKLSQLSAFEIEAVGHRRSWFNCLLSTF